MDTVVGMRTPARRLPAKSTDSLSVELGGWFRAHATGKGVVAIPIVVVVVAAVELIRTFAT